MVFLGLKALKIARVIRNIVPSQLRPIGYLESLTRRRTSCRVRLGPFAGMVYGPRSVGSAYIPKLLGTYECELWALIEEACSESPPLVVDIGAAEGYYAAGLALRNPSSTVVAYESEIMGRNTLREIAVLNGVSSQIEIRGKCEVEDVEATLSGCTRPFVICDVEGYEGKLLDLESAPSLANATILVEMHDFIISGLSELLRARFDSTHEIRCVLQQQRSLGQFPWRTLITCILPKYYLEWAVSEWRPVPMSWLWMQPRKYIRKRAR